ncbi:MAG: c-type cytochrome [Acidobacteria bacterium]|nr:c-type cytochrome [Acidobacteriota bacterium]
MKPLKLLIPAGFVLLVLAAGAILLVPRAGDWYMGLRYPVSPKPAVGSMAWSAPVGSVGTTMPGETDLGANEPPMSRQDADTKLRNPLATSPETIESGKKLFASYCAACHGPEGKGDGPVAKKALFPPPNLQITVGRRSDGFLYATIRNGGAVMTSLDHAIAPQERWQLVSYLRSIAIAPPMSETISGTQPGVTSSGSEATFAPGDAARGKAVYDDNCSTCHAADSDAEIVGPGLKNLFGWPAHRGADGSDHARHTAPMIRKQIVDGGGAMAPMGDAVSGQALEDLLAYLQTL